MPKISLHNQTFSYQIKRKSIRSIRLHLKSKSSFSVSCPQLVPAPIVIAFIRQHQDWIIKHSPKFVSHPKISSLTKINILDRCYNLIIKKDSKNSLVVTTDTLYLTTTHLYQKNLKAILQKYLKPMAQKLIETNTSKLAKTMGVKYKKVVAKNQRTLFGSCSRQNNLNFNWQIIFFPKDKFEHLLIHELAHLVHRHHQKSFWAFVAQFDPNWKQNNKWLKQQGSNHYLFKP